MIPRAQTVSEGFEKCLLSHKLDGFGLENTETKEVELSSCSLTFLVQTRKTKHTSAKKMVMVT